MDKKKRDRLLKGRILSALRKLTWSWEPINNARAKAKVAPSTWECSQCGKWCYGGKSKNSLEKLREDNPDKVVEMETNYADHIEPIVSIEKDYVWSWDVIVNRMFCEEEHIQILCKTCNKEKTNKENELRRKLKKK